MRLITILFLLFQLSSNSFGQELEEFELPPQGKYEYRHCCSGSHKNELGVGNALVYLFKKEAIAYTFHVHYVRNIGDSPYGIGVGYERIFDEDQQQTFAVVGSYRSCRWVVNLFPGVTFEENEGDATELLFAFRAETSYEIEYNNFHFGPYAEVGYVLEDIRLGIGLHVGYGF